MIEDDFYATLKFKSGEEIFAKVAASEEETRTMLLVSNPVIVNEIKSKHGVVGYKVEPWLKTTTDDMFFIDLSDILTIYLCIVSFFSCLSDVVLIHHYHLDIKRLRHRKNVR